MELTQTFIIPQEKYLASLMPSPRQFYLTELRERVRPFNCDDFIKSLEANGLQLTSRFKGDWAGLYKRSVSN